MSNVEFLAYIGAVLTFAIYYMATMVGLRFAAILGSSCYLAYGLLSGFLPMILLNVAILPVNILRLQQMRRVIAQAKSDSAVGLSIEVLYPFMTPMRFQKGEVLFRKGQHSPEMFYIVDGVVRLDELAKSSVPATCLARSACSRRARNGPARPLPSPTSTSCG